MSWDAIGAISEVVGAIAVIATLAYLAVQIRQNTDSVRSAALDASIEKISDSRKSIYESAEMTDIYIRGTRDHEDLDENELLRFRLLMHNFFWCTWNAYAQAELTGLSRGAWDAQKPLISRALSSPGGKWFWSTYKNEFDESFVQDVEQLIDAA